MENNTYYITKDRYTTVTVTEDGLDAVKAFRPGIINTYFIKKGTSVICGNYKDTAIDDGVLVTFYDDIRVDVNTVPFTILYDGVMLEKILSKKKRAEDILKEPASCDNDKCEDDK